jgi:uncharacterized damage-inducible protein DinB
MPRNVIDLMRFVHELRRDFFEAAAKLGPREFTRDREVSMHSVRGVFLHLASVEEQHVTEFCEGRATPWPATVMKIPRDRYRTIPSVRRRLREVTALAERQFRKWDNPRALRETVVWMANQYPLRVSRDMALTQCSTEHLLHLGEIEAMLWQRDVAPPSTFWIDRRLLHGRWPPPPSTMHTPQSLKRLGGAPSRRPRRG